MIPRVRSSSHYRAHVGPLASRRVTHRDSYAEIALAPSHRPVQHHVLAVDGFGHYDGVFVGIIIDVSLDRPELRPVYEVFRYGHAYADVVLNGQISVVSAETM